MGHGVGGLFQPLNVEVGEGGDFLQWVLEPIKYKNSYLSMLFFKKNSTTLVCHEGSFLIYVVKENFSYR